MRPIPSRILIAAGGTGGHLWPAVAMARYIKKVQSKTEFLFVGTGKPVEEKILGTENWNRTVLKASGIKGRGIWGKIGALAKCAVGIFAAAKIIKTFHPGLVIGFGGYVTVPVGLAAKLCKIPLVLHEQNSWPGLSNRVLAKMADLVMLGFEEAAPAFSGVTTVYTGNPVRPEIEALSNLSRDFNHEKARILITGGSQGAAALNKIVSQALVLLHKNGVSFTVTHQTGEADCERIADFYAEAGIENRTEAFFQDMATLYAGADLAISRAGAITIAELAAAKLPSILVPLPTAADDHQTINARHLSERGAAILMPQNDLSPELLAETLAGLLNKRETLKEMSEDAQEVAMLGADVLMFTEAFDALN